MVIHYLELEVETLVHKAVKKFAVAVLKKLQNLCTYWIRLKNKKHS